MVVTTFAEDRIGPYMIELWPDGIQVETYLPLLFEAERSFDEERAWVATFGDENWDEFDDTLYFDALNTDNFRSRDSRNEYGEDALIYNDLILEGQDDTLETLTFAQKYKGSETVVRLRAQTDFERRFFGAMTKARIREYALDRRFRLRPSMPKGEMIETLVFNRVYRDKD